MARLVIRKPARKNPLDDFMVIEETPIPPSQKELDINESSSSLGGGVRPEESEKKIKVIKGDDKAIPDEWPNGSAVMSDDSDPHGWPYCGVKYETIRGFLGRQIREDNLYLAWAWLNNDYVYLGATDDLLTSFRMLSEAHGKPTTRKLTISNKKIKATRRKAH